MIGHFASPMHGLKGHFPLSLVTQVISRDFINFDSLVQTHCLLAKPFKPTNGCKLRCKIAIKPTGNKGIFGHKSKNNNYMRISSTSEIRVVSDSGASYVRPTSTGDDRLHELEFVGTDTTGELFIDGVSQGVSAGNFSTFNINVIGDYLGLSTPRFFDGIIADPELETEGVTTSFTLNMPVGTAGNIEYSQNNTFGINKWNSNPNVVQVGWVDNLDGTYTCDGTASALISDNAGLIENDKAYEITYKITGHISGSVRALLYGASQVGIGTSKSADGIYTEVVTVNTETGSGNLTGRVTMQSISSFNGTVTLISAREIQGNALSLKGLYPDQQNKYMLTSDGTQYIAVDPSTIPQIIEVA